MNFTELISSAEARGNQVTIGIPPDWQQGRAIYGGLTAAICLRAALPHADGRPPRAMQIAFVGPAGGSLTATPTVLRRGSNTVFVSVRLVNDVGVAAEATIVFAARRESGIRTRALIAPDVPNPGDCGAFLPPAGISVENFAQKFQMRPGSRADMALFGADAHRDGLTMWLRHGDGTQPVDAVSVLGLADGPPPAAAVRLDTPAPLSSMTWMAEFLVDEFDTDEGWFLAHHVDEFADGGYSTQSMTLFDTERRPVMVGRQTVTIFA